MMQLKDLMKLYGVVLLLHLSTLYVGQSEMLTTLSKGLLMTILTIWFYDQSRWTDKWTRLFGIAQILSFVGDLLLEFEGLFLAGLGSFLIAQIGYFSSFRAWTQEFSIPLTKSIIAAILPIALLVTLVLPQAKSAGELMIPILIYAFILSAVWWQTIRLFLMNYSRFALLFLGSTIFLISDAFLAFNLFLGDLPYSSLWIMSTYGIAQFLYTLSAFRQLRQA